MQIEQVCGEPKIEHNFLASLCIIIQYLFSIHRNKYDEEESPVYFYICLSTIIDEVNSIFSDYTDDDFERYKDIYLYLKYVRSESRKIIAEIEKNKFSIGQYSHGEVAKNFYKIYVSLRFLLREIRKTGAE